ncbi:MAG: C39 family peptidase [Myxococcales bacterium]|nr:C39 family peptidase [Myxococcales bacterium]
MAQHHAQLELPVLPQPDNTTCGPTCLHAVYRYWEHELPLPQVIDEVDSLPEGGTLAVNLACHALRRGFRAELFTYNLQLFDPTWFDADVDLAERLRSQAARKQDPKLALATDNYLQFLELGGQVRFVHLNGALLRRYLKQGIPLLTGLSATYLYDCARERDDDYDDVAGYPTGHFVVLSGYDRKRKEVMVADPLHDNPRFGGQYYSVTTGRLIAAILLGIVTYDANLLVLTPPETPA